MTRSYEHISKYEKQINEMRAYGKSVREISEELGFSIKQIRNFITRYNQKQKRIEAGIALKAKGRPPKDYEVTENMKVAELKYIIDRKDSKIKRLEMENELMRDFLSLTERK